MDKNFKRLLILAGALGVTNYVGGIGKDVVNIVVAPEDTALILDGSTTIKPGQIKLKTGTHTIKASRQDFTDQTKEFTTVNGAKNVVWFNMIPSNQVGEEYRNTNQAEFQKVYDVANGQVVKSIDDKVANYPIIKYLPASTNTLLLNSEDPKWAPYDAEKYVINSGQSQKHPYDSSKIALYITADHPAGRQSAIAYIYSIGLDPADYEIIFETTTSSSTGNGGTGIGDFLNQSVDDEPFPNESEYIVE
jgi:hypothetical protein